MRARIPTCICGLAPARQLTLAWPHQALVRGVALNATSAACRRQVLGHDYLFCGAPDDNSTCKVSLLECVHVVHTGASIALPPAAVLLSSLLHCQAALEAADRRLDSLASCV